MFCWGSEDVTWLLLLLLLLLLPVLLLLPLSLLGGFFIFDLFYTGLKRGIWKRHATAALQQHLAAALAAVAGGPITFWCFKLRQQQQQQQQQERQWKQLQQELLQRTGVYVPVSVFAASYSEAALIEEIRRLSPFAAPLVEPNPWWLLGLLQHSPTDVTHDTAEQLLL